MVRSFSSASQRAKPYKQVAVLGLIALTVLFTLSSVRHLAGAIAARHSLANRTDNDIESRTLLDQTEDGVNKGLPHWLHDGSVRQSTASVRSSVPAETGTQILLPIHPSPIAQAAAQPWHCICSCKKTGREHSTTQRGEINRCICHRGEQHCRPAGSFCAAH